MDPRRFDHLARLLAAATDRRTLGGLVAGIFTALSDFDPTAARKRGKRAKKKARKRVRRRKRQNQRQTRNAATSPEESPTQAEARRCCSRNTCTPGAGKNLGRCCFVDEDLSGRTLRGANLGQANLTGADLRDADLRGANLGQACLVDTDLRDARINGSTNMGGAIFCHTLMPDGRRNTSGCTDATRCCPTCHADDPCPGGEVCCHGRCRVGDCCDAADCSERTCQTPICEDNTCRYAPVPNTESGPGCADPRICCTEPGADPVCCLVQDTTCTDAGVCCEPDCAGKVCGPDGCDGSCGTCASGQICNADGQCVCTAASCPGGCCASDETCHTPPSNQFCGTGGAACATCTGQDQCQNGTCVCVPDCDGKVCGSNGCGGTCRPGCTDPLAPTCCGGSGCKSLENDPANCGACGRACENGEPCILGACGCDVCANGCRYASLREALDEAKDGDTIRICPGNYRTNVTITKNLTIAGVGAVPGDTKSTDLNGSNAGSVIVNLADTVTLQGLIISLGQNGSGGGILNTPFPGPASTPTLTLIDCFVIGNTATDSSFDDGGGGGIYSGGGDLILGRNVGVNTNTATGDGGGIYITGGTLTMQSDSLVFKNIAEASGGGIYVDDATVTLETSSRVQENAASDFGGGIYNSGGTVIVEAGAGVHDNNTNGDGGGIYNSGGTVTIANHLDVDGNGAGGVGNNCAGSPPVPNCSN